MNLLLRAFLLAVTLAASPCCLQPAPTGDDTGTCNAAVPNTSVYSRFLWVIMQVLPTSMCLIPSSLDPRIRMPDSPSPICPITNAPQWPCLMTLRACLLDCPNSASTPASLARADILRPYGLWLA